MSSNGRPPKPTELKRVQGTLRADRNPESVLPIKEHPEGLPEPSGVAGSGSEFWVLAWRTGWISSVSDHTLVCIVAQQLTERDTLRLRVLEANNPRDRSGLRELEKQIVGNLGQLGFSPAERSRLGLTGVKAESKLEALIRAREEHMAKIKKA
jgi:hypothetical protein